MQQLVEGVLDVDARGEVRERGGGHRERSLAVLALRGHGLLHARAAVVGDRCADGEAGAEPEATLNELSLVCSASHFRCPAQPETTCLLFFFFRVLPCSNAAAAFCLEPSPAQRPGARGEAEAAMAGATAAAAIASAAAPPRGSL